MKNPFFFLADKIFSKYPHLSGIISSVAVFIAFSWFIHEEEKIRFRKPQVSLSSNPTSLKAKISETSTLARSFVPEVNIVIIKPFFPGLSPHTPLLVWSLIRWPREPKNLPEPAEDCLLVQDLKVKCSSRLHKHSTGKGKCLGKMFDYIE